MDSEETVDAPSTNITASTVGKLHAVFGKPNPVTERALGLHKAHAEQQRDPMFVLRESFVSGLWSKPAFILSVMLQRLNSSTKQRIHWCIDADIVVTNRSIPSDVLVQPSAELDYMNVLVINDHYRLNNGCFLIKISPWGVKVLSVVLLLRTFEPEIKMPYSEQSALEETI
ncbi:hypothetical protein BJ878DRAFT_431036 [Calycina marina]|uniref:Uncharacterized protein n=1 Tax=Calycina marina TaxID=1763456 RepID=A0A9P7YU86_9HELO|nr:hypothetical protein BJ878DRAFT_431036 [Calycina marina]